MKRVGLIRVLLVDEAVANRQLLAATLSQQDGVRVVAAAAGAVDARAAILQHQPDVVVLDVSQEDGLRLLQRLRRHYPVPTIVYTGAGVYSGPRVMRAAAMGAVEYALRPTPLAPEAAGRFTAELAQKIRLAFLEARPVPPGDVATHWQPAAFSRTGMNPAQYLILVGASTGGTEAIRAMLANTPADFPPVAIVQHMPADFTASFAARLDRFSAMTVTEARDGERLAPGRAVVARGDTHLTVRGTPGAWVARYTDQTPVNRHCPSVDVLFDSGTRFGGNIVGVLLTGMGADGAGGLLRLRQARALTITQDARSCVVYGMPKIANDLGAAMLCGSPDEIPRLIEEALAGRTGRRHSATVPPGR
jgi:two-component system chemotaxis response regulator CheB